MSLSRLLLSLALSICALAPLSTVAVAQDVSADKVEKFEQHVAKGAEQFKAENYQTALEEFRAARQIVDHPKLSYKIGRTLGRMGRCDEARTAFERYLAYDKLDESDREQGRKQLEDLDNCKPMGRLQVECKQEDARVAVAERSVACPADIRLPAGDYTVQVSAPGEVTRQLDVTIEGSSTLQQDVDLSGESVDEDQVDNTDAGGAEWIDYAKWGSIGVGGALIISGVASDLSAIGRNDRIDEAREQNDTERLQELEDEADRARTRTIIFYATGGTFLAAGITFAILDKPPSTSQASNSGSSPHAPKAGLRIGPGRAGLFLRW